MTELFAGDAHCPACRIHCEKRMARFEWIPGQPETVRWDCERCRERDAITDGSVQLALVNQMVKGARQNLKNLQRIAAHLSPAMKAAILYENGEVIRIVNELISVLRESQTDRATTK